MGRGVDRLDTLGEELTDLVDLIDMQLGTIQLEQELVRVSNVVDTAMAAVEPVLARQDQVVNLRLDNPGTELWADHGRGPGNPQPAHERPSRVTQGRGDRCIRARV